MNLSSFAVQEAVQMSLLFQCKLEGPLRCNCRQYKTNFSSFQGIRQVRVKKSCIFAEINSSAPSGAFSQPSFHTSFQVGCKIPGPVPLSKTVFLYVPFSYISKLRFGLYDFFSPSLRIAYVGSMTQGPALWGKIPLIMCVHVFVSVCACGPQLSDSVLFAAQYPQCSSGTSCIALCVVLSSLLQAVCIHLHVLLTQLQSALH